MSTIDERNTDEHNSELTALIFVNSTMSSKPTKARSAVAASLPAIPFLSLISSRSMTLKSLRKTCSSNMTKSGDGGLHQNQGHEYHRRPQVTVSSKRKLDRLQSLVEQDAFGGNLLFLPFGGSSLWYFYRCEKFGRQRRPPIGDPFSIWCDLQRRNRYCMLLYSGEQ